MSDQLHMKKHAWKSLLACCALLAIAPACGDDKDHDHEAEEGAGEDNLTGDCKVISTACHEHDEGTGLLHSCHELAHENKADVCTEKKDECVAACEDAH